VEAISEKIASKLSAAKPKENLQRAIETHQWHRENEAKLEELKAKVQDGEMTEADMMVEYNEWMIR
jgi:hypothetical protein